ncbi:FecR family protein [Flavobacterium lindanitolerans]|uniref:FecR family protein n=1 Tax=Flavobacterium lindanitolerans TaxID=428988 RepID=UPI0027B9C1B5|nr:FecR family protein [Flavobacterium lindanitolerans]
MNRDQHIRQLFERYISGKCTEAELDQLVSYLEDPDGDNELMELISAEMQRDDHTEDTEQVIAITQNAERHIFDRTRPKPFYQTTLFRIAIAALLLIGIAVLVIIGDKKKQVEIIADAQISLPAGTDKAILSLSDGRKVELGNTANTDLAKESGSNIIQQDGEIIYNGNKLESNATNQLEVPNGGKYSVTISDGTKIWLNAGSKIIYPVSFAGKSHREIVLYGEAYFEVAKDRAKPFIVRTERQKIEVLGTHFNINSYTDEPQAVTTLTEGSVRITETIGKQQAFTLRPGEMAATSQDQTKVGMADMESALAWQKDLFFFKKASLRNIMRQVARWYDVQVEFKGNVPERYFTGGVHRNANLSELLKILMLNDIHFTLMNNQKNRKLIVEP